jgi:NADPH:quinone reductase-like Zn-dependent oxidoreductase
MSNKMKAAFFTTFGELDNIEIGDMDRPEPGDGEVLVKVKAAGVNPVDAAVARGMLKDAIPAEFPVIPGWDVAGVVEENGFAARRFKEGDEVYAYARRPTIQKGRSPSISRFPKATWPAVQKKCRWRKPVEFRWWDSLRIRLCLMRVT